MDSIFNFLRSDLFLSLLGGFAIGVAGLTLIKPATASDVPVEAAQSISIGKTIYETASKRP